MQRKQIQRNQMQKNQIQNRQTKRQTKSEAFTLTLKNRIQEGTYPYGTALPAERELAEGLGLNRSTVRAAIQTLVEEGLLKKVQGKGTFVMRHAQDDAYTHFRGMSELLKNHGYVPSSRILYTGPTAAGYKLSRLLQVGERSVRLGFKEFEVMRLLMVNSRAVVSKETLIAKIWGLDSEAEDNNVEVYISFLRKKLAYLGSSVAISTVRKVGYYLEHPGE